MSDKIKDFVAKAATNPMGQIQTTIERIILYSRYLLVIFYIGLAAALAIYAVTFIFEALDDSPEWLRRLDPGSLKVKVATALLTISAVKLL